MNRYTVTMITILLCLGCFCLGISVGAILTAI